MSASVPYADPFGSSDVLDPDIPLRRMTVLSTARAVHAPHLPTVSNLERGENIKRRRLALGLRTPAEFSQESGFVRRTINNAEAGDPSTRDSTYDALERWLEDREEELGHTAEESSPIRVTFRDVTTSSIGEIVVEGPAEHVDALRLAIAGLLADVRRGEGV